MGHPFPDALEPRGEHAAVRRVGTVEGNLSKLQSVELIRFLASFSIVLHHYGIYFLFNSPDDLPLSQLLVVF
jgi:hypothetical protein